MNHKEDKKLFVKHDGQKVLIGTIGTLGLLCLLSFLFIDQNLFQWQRTYMPVCPEPWHIKTFVLLGKAWALVWLVLCWGLLGNQRKRSLIVLVGMLLVISVLPIKLATQRPRPRNIVSNKIPVTAMEKLTHSWSFPSGDTAAAFAVAAGMAPFVGAASRIVLFSIAGFVGFFRVAMYAHYASDAIGGVILGITCAYIGYRLIVSRPGLREGLLNHFSKTLMTAGIILIPVVHGVSGNWDEVKTFVTFYPAAVLALYVIHIHHPHFSFNCQGHISNWSK